MSTAGESTPDYLPARMLNEFVYCPRLFYYEWVEGVFAANREVVEGSLRHQKLERKDDALAPAEEAAASGESIHSRSVALSSDTHRLIAKLDLIEGEGGVVTPVDYKRGSPREVDGELQAWDADRAQLCAQALVLRDNGYRCDEAVVYYVMTKQRVRVAIDERLVAETLAAVEQARQTPASEQIPPPLVDSPKCPRCSLVGICLPDETWAFRESRRRDGSLQKTLFEIDEPPGAELTDAAREGDVRRLVPARDDLRPLYVNTQGLYIGKSGNVLKIKDKDTVVQEVRMGEICQLNLMGNVQLSTQAVQTLCENEVPIAYFSQGGWFYGVTPRLPPDEPSGRQRRTQRRLGSDRRRLAVDHRRPGTGHR